MRMGLYTLLAPAVAGGFVSTAGGVASVAGHDAVAGGACAFTNCAPGWVRVGAQKWWGSTPARADAAANDVAFTARRAGQKVDFAGDYPELSRTTYYTPASTC